MSARIRNTASTVLCAALGLTPPSVVAGNAINLIGFGAESVAMGGADLAVARDTSALNTNPAGLAQIPGSELNLNAAVAHLLDAAHADQFGNDQEVSDKEIYIASGGYARRFADAPFSAGVAIFVQGGAGSVYRDLATPFGTRDDLSIQLGIVKLSPGIAWRVTPEWSLGASLSVVASRLEQKVFPDTSTPAFAGLHLKDMESADAGLKLGALYKPSERLTFGAAYTTKSDLSLEDGTLVANMTAVGLGKVTYRNARIEGMAQPQQFGVGLALRPAPVWLVAFDLEWINWADAMKTSTLRADSPDNSLAPPSIAATSSMNWHNQLVFAIGAVYELSPKSVLRAGYNYGRNPIPDETLTPLLNSAIGEHTLTCGIGYEPDPTWRVDASLEWQLKNSVTYHNPELPFGPGATESTGFVALHAMLTRRW
jgi:long-chain fatty acid transport protein